MTKLFFLWALAATGDPESFLQPGDSLWVGHGMAKGYDLPFGQELRVKKVRHLIMGEVRVKFYEFERPFYLRIDFGPNYAFREDPKQAYDFTPEEWEDIRRGHIALGMTKRKFLCIKPKSEEIHYQPHAEGPIEQWIYRDEPIQLFGARHANPPTQIYYFQNDLLIAIL